MQVIKVGVIGFGRRLRELMAKIPGIGKDIRIIAIADPSPKVMSATDKMVSPETLYYECYEKMLAESDIEWVMIGSLNSQHAEHIIMSAKAGKNVFCEKPLATTMEDCQTIKQTIIKSNIKFSLGLVLRYSSHYQKIKEWIDSGIIGSIISIEFNETLSFDHGGHIHGNWRRKEVLGGGHMLEKCCHDLDLLLWLTQSTPVQAASFGGKKFFLPENRYLAEEVGFDKNGRPAYQGWGIEGDENPFTSESEVVDNQVAIIEFDNGIHASFHTNCNTSIPERRMYICGTKGTIRSDLRGGFAECKPIGYEQHSIRFDGDSGSGHGNGDEILARDLAKCMKSSKKPLAGIKEGIDSLRLALAIDVARKQNKIIFLD